MVFIPDWDRFKQIPRKQLGIDWGGIAGQYHLQAVFIKDQEELVREYRRPSYVYDGVIQDYIPNAAYWSIGATEATIICCVTPNSITDNGIIYSIGGAASFFQGATMWADNSGFNTSNPNCISLNLSGDSGSRLETGANTIGVNKRTNTSFTYHGGPNEMLFLIGDEQHSSLTGGSIPNSWTGDANLRLGGTSVLDNYDGTIEYIFLFSKAVPDEVLHELQHNPFLILKSDVSYFYLSASVPGVIGSGSLVSGNSSISAVGKRIIVSTLAGLQAGNSSISGLANRQVAGSGNLSAEQSIVSGIGYSGGTATGFGALAAAASNISGAGKRVVVGNANLQASSSFLSAIGTRKIIASGVLVSGASEFSATGVVGNISIGSANLISNNAEFSGVGNRKVTGSGALLAGNFTFNGVGSVSGTILGAAALQSNQASFSGIATRKVLGQGVLISSFAIISGNDLDLVNAPLFFDLIQVTELIDTINVSEQTDIIFGF